MRRPVSRGMRYAPNDRRAQGAKRRPAMKKISTVQTLRNEILKNQKLTIGMIHTDRQLLLLQNFVSQCLHSANLLHSRSPFCALSASIIGSVSHPAGDRPSHLI